MLADTATRALEDGLSLPARGIDVPARVAGLRAVGGGDLDEGSAERRGLVLQLLDEASPAGAEDAPREAVVRLHHVADLELLDDDDRVALAESRRDFVEHVVALPTHLPVQDGDAMLGLLPVLRSLLLAADVALSASELLRRGVQVLRVDDEVAVAVGDDVGHAAIERDSRRRARRGFGDLGLVDQAREPLPGLLAQGARLRLADGLAVDDGAQVAELREADHLAFETPHLRVRFAEAERVETLALPAWRPSKLREAARPRLVEFDEKLSAHVPRHVREPRQLGAERRQLVDLVEGASSCEDALSFCIDLELPRPQGPAQRLGYGVNHNG